MRTRNVREYMLVLALCLVYLSASGFLTLRNPVQYLTYAINNFPGTAVSKSPSKLIINCLRLHGEPLNRTSQEFIRNLSSILLRRTD